MSKERAEKAVGDKEQDSGAPMWPFETCTICRLSWRLSSTMSSTGVGPDQCSSVWSIIQTSF